MRASSDAPSAGNDQPRWQDCALQDVTRSISTGPFGSLLHKHDYIDDGVPVINPVNLVDGRIECDARVTVSVDTAHRLSVYRVQAGDVLVARRGDIGRCAVATRDNEGWLCGTGCFFVRPSNSLDSRFLALLLGSPEYRKDLEASSSGATMLNLSNTALGALTIRLPPLDEQKRIVAKLDQAFASLDCVRANAEATATDLIQMRDSIISVSLDSALDASSKRIRLGELCAIARGGSPRPISKFLTDEPSGINWIKISDATASGKFIESTKEKITQDGISRSRYVTSGSFLLTNSMSFGRPYILRTNGCIHDGWLVLEPDYKQVDQEYLYYLLGSRKIYEEFDRSAAGSTVRNLNIGLVSRVCIRLPPLEKQREAVASIVAAVSAVDKLAKANEIKLADIAALRQSLLQAAFSGQLS